MGLVGMVGTCRMVMLIFWPFGGAAYPLKKTSWLILDLELALEIGFCFGSMYGLVIVDYQQGFWLYSDVLLILKAVVKTYIFGCGSRVVWVPIFRRTFSKEENKFQMLLLSSNGVYVPYHQGKDGRIWERSFDGFFLVVSLFWDRRIW